jgi:hypothetical protein
MELCRRRLRPGELDHESLWLGVSLGGLLAAALWLRLDFPWPQCTFLRLTGHPCLSCGATRAAIEFFRGHFLASLRWNPLAFLFFCGVAAFDVYATLVLVSGAPRLRVILPAAVEKRWIRIALVILLALNWIYLLSNSNRFAA